MLVKQISVFVENKSGRLAEVASCLAAEGIDTRALSLADTTDFGVLRLIVNKPDKALETLKNCEFTVSITDVIAVMVPDVPGGLAEVLEVFKSKKIDIEYMYAFLGNEPDKATVILRINNPEATIQELKDTKIHILEAQEVYSM